MTALSATEWKCASKAWAAMKRGHSLDAAWRRADATRHGITRARMDVLIWDYRAALANASVD